MTILGKAEWYNPGGSVKDRPALWMIRDGEKSGRLTPDKTILDATSGNTGIAYAWIGAALGYKVKLSMPKNASEERKKILRAYGVEVVLTDPGEGSDGAIREAGGCTPRTRRSTSTRTSTTTRPTRGRTTSPRPRRSGSRPDGEITHFVAGLGTSGTFVGTATRLREHDPDIKVISFEPDSPFHGLEGMKHMASAIVPPIYDPTIADQNLGTPTEDAYEMVKRAGARGGHPRRHLRRGRGGDVAACGAGARVRRSRHGLVRQRGQVPLRELLGGVGPCRSRSARETSATSTSTPRRPTRRSAAGVHGRHERRGHEGSGGRLAGREHPRRGALAPLSHRPAGVHEVRGAGRREGPGRSSGSTTPTRTTRPSPRSTTGSTPGPAALTS